MKEFFIIFASFMICVGLFKILLTFVLSSIRKRKEE